MYHILYAAQDNCLLAHHQGSVAAIVLANDENPKAELVFLFPKATFPLATSQLQYAIAQRSDSTVVELDGEIVAFANFYRWEAGGCCSIGNVIVSPAVRGRGVGRYLIEQKTRMEIGLHLFTCGCRETQPNE